MTCLEFYTCVVLALADGKQVSFQMAKSKPRVRDRKHAHGYSIRLKELETSRRDMARAKVLANNPALNANYYACKVSAVQVHAVHRMCIFSGIAEGGTILI